VAAINRNGVLAGKVAVVTGASRGIGEAIAIRYAMEGAKVVVSARTENEGEHILGGSINGVVERIRRAGGEATAVRCDLTADADRVALIKAAEDTYGPVDILVNNAAVSWFIPVATFPEKRWRIMFEVQAYAPFHLAQLVLPKMREKRSGWILNLSTHSAGHPDLTKTPIHDTVYGMAKAALERFTTGLAQEVYADNICVNAISPFIVATPGVVHLGLINDENRAQLTSVEQCAEACLLFCSGAPAEFSGRIACDMDIVNEYKLQAAELVS
jgi:NAD(P)-dependent dehydrogenase (short-subunit alcohol dehydrogenase family)